MKDGIFITFEGGEGAGKSTQIARLAAVLRAKSHDVVQTREPGGSPGAEDIRRLLLSSGSEHWDVESEALMMIAARRSHLVATIWPALAAGKIVLCDRFADSTEAYQGWGRGLSREKLRDLHRLIAGDFTPDLTLILDLPPAEGLERAQKRGDTTRFERMTIGFHERLRQGFLAIAKREPDRCAVIDAAQDVDAVAAAVIAAVRERLQLDV